MTTFLDLPEYLVDTILSYLPPEDILRVQQTCRGMHALASSDYLWHGIQFDLPLDVPAVYDATESQPASLLQQSTVRALRLHHNWIRKNSSIKRLQLIPGTDIVNQLQFAGSEYIVTLSQSGTLATYLTVWSTKPPFSRVARIEVPHCNRFAASFQENELVVATLTTSMNNTGSLKLYTILFSDDSGEDFKEIFCESLAEPGHVFFDVHLSGGMAIAGLAALGNTIQYSLLLVDIMTRSFRAIDLPSEGKKNIQFKLYRDCVFMLALIDNETKLQIIQYDFDGHALAEYYISRKPVEYHVSVEPTTHCSNAFPVVLQHTSDRNTLGNRSISVYMVPLAPTAHDNSPKNLEQVYTFPITRGRSPDLLCVGETGSRMVWLERGWEADEYQFMKAAFGPRVGERPIVAPLWPAHAGLPFETHTCHALYLEECTGRICFALHTEKLYIMEF